MIPSSLREWLLCFFMASAVAFGILIGLKQHDFAGISLFVLLLSIFCLAANWALVTPPVDIWKPQREIMAKSDQHIPLSPELNKGVLLYSALMMEEGSETFSAICTALREGNIAVTAAGRSQHDPALERILIALEYAARYMRTQALTIRNDLAMVRDFYQPLNREQTREILDGSSDTAVVLAGFGISAGLPNGPGYMEVCGSNLSKEDPKTKKIEKDPSGKWIKGPNYWKPDLDRVIGTNCVFSEDFVSHYQ